MSTIKTGTTLTTAYQVEGDTTGALVIQTGATPTTALTIDSSQNITTAKKLATASMPTGAVLQVVSANYSTQVSSTTSSAIDTGLSASITPTSATSKILVSVYHTGLYVSSGVTAINLQLMRNGSYIANIGNVLGYAAVSFSNSASVLDSPATTSSTTYKTQMVNWQNTGTVYSQWQSSTSYIVLMEIAA